MLGATWSSNSILANAPASMLSNLEYTFKYGRVIELLSYLEINKLQVTYWQFIKQLAKIDRLIISDLLLSSTTQQEHQDLMEVIKSVPTKYPQSFIHKLKSKYGIYV